MNTHQMDVPQPVEMYDTVRAECVKTIDKPMPSVCLLHKITRLKH